MCDLLLSMLKRSGAGTCKQGPGGFVAVSGSSGPVCLVNTVIVWRAVGLMVRIHPSHG